MRRPARPCLLLVFVLAVSSLGLRVFGDEPRKPSEDDYELFQVFADTLDQVERNYVKDVSRRELMEAAIHGVLSKLDPYSNYIGPEDISRFKTSVESQFGGIGIQIGMEYGHGPDEPAMLKVISPLIGTPAYRAGIEAGDTILEINGKSTRGIDRDEAVRQLKGEPGTKVTLLIRHLGATENETVNITREWVHVDTVLGDRRKPDDTWDFMLDHDKHIGYVRIVAFSRDTAEDVKKAVQELNKEGLKGLIIDLRFNPGGLLNSAIEVSDLFVSSGRIVSTKGRNTPERVWEAQKEGTFEGFPMAILVNRYSASASEIFSACLQDNKRAKVIGERTWGKGSVQNVIELEGGKSALKLTTASYHRPNGKNIHRFPDSKETDEWGVMPDDGYELKLTGLQTSQLIRYRHDRDILLGKHAKAEQAKQDAAKAEATKNEPPAEATDKDQANKDQATKTDNPKADKPDTPATQPDSQGADKPAEKPAAEPSKKEAAESDDDEGQVSAEFVDVQLQKAVDYLTQELARAP